jgi:uncharacterized protein
VARRWPPYTAFMLAKIAALHRYPVKGLSPERLRRVDLVPGGYVPGDRLFAIENGPSGFDPAAPQHQPKVKFLMLMRHGSLARLRTRYEDATGTLIVHEDGREVARGDLGTIEGRQAIAAFFETSRLADLRGRPEVLTAPEGFSFTDSRQGYVSIINLASVDAIEALARAPVDPLRFRGNVQVEGLEPWAEFDLVGQVIRTEAGVRLKVLNRIERCAATEVDPDTGLRDLAVPALLMRHYGHRDCGVYAEVLSGGLLTEGDRLDLESAD